MTVNVAHVLLLLIWKFQYHQKMFKVWQKYKDVLKKFKFNWMPYTIFVRECFCPFQSYQKFSKRLFLSLGRKMRILIDSAFLKLQTVAFYSNVFGAVIASLAKCRLCQVLVNVKKNNRKTTVVHSGISVGANSAKILEWFCATCLLRLDDL